ncbi:peptidoglycan bridge formation glycyltransferase FemA/FemB family protein [Candidatus Woesebacteria bacterium]|nr:peptidoglycan bridge formation glycyltransferase FemA/FemB family protein [Candidatus Woesebacteria bacterium]
MIRPLREEERSLYNSSVTHPLQSWEWGEFKKKTGQKVERVGFFTNGKLTKALQVSFHQIPVLGGTAGYLPKSFMPDEEQLEVLQQLGKQHSAVFIKLEPDIDHPAESTSAFNQIITFLAEHNAKPGRPLFTRYTFKINLAQTEKELFANLSQKTRYNVRLAIKKGVEVVENTTAEGMQQYVKILSETTKRQGFYAHTPEYFQTMWESMGSSGMLRIFEAKYEGTCIASWVMFLLNDRLYYPYGASIDAHREVMASNLMLWEMIRFGKAQNCKEFDLWGALGPNEKKSHPWYGFHRFKAGYGGTLMEYLGSFDLVLQPMQYQLFRLGENARWKLLRAKTRLGL